MCCLKEKQDTSISINMKSNQPNQGYNNGLIKQFWLIVFACPQYSDEQTKIMVLLNFAERIYL